jgi:hypothetical protein
MRRFLAPLALALALTVTGGTNAQAITGNAIADTEHTYVGLIAFYDKSGELTHRCTGSLLTDTVFLTAGHCVTLDTAGTLAVSARIWFEQDAGAGYDPVTHTPAGSGYPVIRGVKASTFHNYGFAGAKPPQTHDLGLVILDEPVTDAYPEITQYASLGRPGTIEKYTESHPGTTAAVTLSGYGVTDPDQNADPDADVPSRLEADTYVTSLDDPVAGGVNAGLAEEPGNGGGGSCFGDSGGPVLLEGTDVITAVTSFGNSTCTGTSYSYRTDLQPPIDWILDRAGSEADEIDIVGAGGPAGGRDLHVRRD